MTKQTFAPRFLVAVVAAMLMMASYTAAQRVSESELLFREALHKQQVEGDLGAAIKIYQRIISSRNSDRAVVAKSLLQLGSCYEKQGNAEARKAYERLVREFGDQSDAVREARTRLAEIAPTVDARRDVTVRKLAEWRRTSGRMNLSRDGRFIVRGEPWPFFTTLLLFDLASGTEREIGRGRLVGPGEFIISAAISPDGLVAAYTTLRAGSLISDLRMIRVNAAEPRTVLSNSKPKLISDWSLDGSTVLLAEEDVDRREGTLVQMNVATGQAKPLPIPKWLTNFGPREEKRRFGPRLSPDARFIAYAVQEGDNFDRTSLFVSALDGSSPRKIAGGGLHAAYPYAWTPDARNLLFISNESGSYSLWTVAVKDGSPAGQPAVLKKDIGDVHPVAIDDRGRLYYSVQGDQTRYFGELDVAGAQVGNLRSMDRDDIYLTWSPDGKRALVLRWGIGELNRQELMPPRGFAFRDVASGQEREIKPPDGFVLHEAGNWTPDGKAIVTFVRSGNEFKLAWADADTGQFRIGPKVSDPNAVYYDPMMATDGQHVFAAKVVRNSNGTFVLVRIKVDTGQEEPICMGKAIRSPARPILAAPDFSQAACADSEGIRIVAMQGGAVRDLVKAKDTAWMSWTPEGKHIIYLVEERPAGNNLVRRRQAWIIPVSGGEPRKLNLPFGAMNLTIHPDGRQVAIFGSDDSTELWVMENLKFN